MGYMRKTGAFDVGYIAERLRPADLEEIKASIGDSMSPLEVLRLSVKRSGGNTRTICATDGEPLALFGVVPGEFNVGGTIWMMGTPELEKHGLEFLRKSKRLIGELNKVWPVLSNVVYHKNTVHIRWLKWLGFTVDEEHPTTNHWTGEKFFKFERRAT